MPLLFIIPLTPSSLVNSFSETQVQTHPKLIASFINQITARTGLELVYISNFGSPDQSSVIEKIQYPLSIFQIDSIRQKPRDIGKEICPVFGASVSPNITYATILIPENKVYVRNDVLTFENRHRIIFIWVQNSTAKALSLLTFYAMTYSDETYDFGLLHPESRASNFSSPNVGSKGGHPSGLPSFPSFDNFHGFEIHIGAISYSPYITANASDEDDQSKSDYVLFKDYSGFEIDMLNNAAHIHNFTYQIQNEPNGFWEVLERMSSNIYKKMRKWISVGRSCWFTYGTFMGENEDSHKIPTSSALIWLCCSWFNFCLISPAGYSTKLKSFLTNPIFSKSINTIEDVLESGLPWGMVNYDELEQHMMERINDSSIKKIWKDSSF
ncbi:unnamed protein product [Lepeophtheirus salmonis]|uniref:(salmon louse) hypothetical protein n=1 Tax=Lepeophtheirus salmonis TaxID=72036 RepID=A0A7R8D602_LEPSM|nr:unnamed protein product [Lepeophtheirus salmonis]CAF3039939.1 unnamed protein product [Lepeophtheirus salmonis]